LSELGWKLPLTFNESLKTPFCGQLTAKINGLTHKICNLTPQHQRQQ